MKRTKRIVANVRNIYLLICAICTAAMHGRMPTEPLYIIQSFFSCKMLFAFGCTFIFVANPLLTASSRCFPFQKKNFFVTSLFYKIEFRFLPDSGLKVNSNNNIVSGYFF